MVIKREVAYGIVRGLSEFWKCDELQDFTVNFGSNKFGCHKFLLAACSGFFRGLFRSEMKEVELNHVFIDDISSMTFGLIIESLYTGHGVLTNDNVIDIWHAANQLQITFLIEECDDFVLRSLTLDNYEVYFYHAKLMDRNNVLIKIWELIIQNFDLFATTASFLELRFSDLINLVKNQDLKVSNENIVIESVLRWIDYDTRLEIKHGEQGNKMKDNNVTNRKGVAMTTENRCDSLVQLLSATRTCLCSIPVLEQTIKHPTIENNKEARDIILKAIFYNVKKDQRNRQWSSSAVHRNCEQFENVAVSFKTNGVAKLTDIFVYSFTSKAWCKTKSIPENKSCHHPKGINIDNSLNVFGIDEPLLHRSVLGNDSWNTSPCYYVEPSVTFSSEAIHIEIIDQSLYILKSAKKRFLCLDTTSNTFFKLDLPFINVISNPHLMAHGHKLLLFHDHTPSNATQGTAVECFHTDRQTWTQLSHLDGPAERLTTFQNDRDRFILQTNGDLWKIVQSQSDVIDFEFVSKLWNQNWPLHGAVTFMDELFIFGVTAPTCNFLNSKSLPGIFKQITYIESETTGHLTFIPSVIAKKHLNHNL